MVNKVTNELFPDLVAVVNQDKQVPVEVSKEDQDARAAEIDSMYGEGFDMRKLMDEAEDPLTGTLRDLKIDDRDLPLAKNYYDYIYNLSGPLIARPWARQMYSSLMLFGEICPKCSNKKWLSIENVPKDYDSINFPEHYVLLEHGVCPKCKRNKRQLVKHGRIFPYTECVYAWGQRSGKSSTVVSQSDYHLHRFLKFPRFSSLSNLLSAATPLTFTFVSLTLGKAISVLWEPFLGHIENNEWHQRYRELMDFYGQKYGKELYVIKKEFIKFHYKKLHLLPASPDKSTLRGETRFGAALDELGLFRLPASDEDEDTKQIANADEAHKSLSNSLLTVRSEARNFLKRGYFHTPTGMLFNCSSVMSERDKIMRLLKDAQGSEGRKVIYGSQLATWEVNPGIDKDSPDIKAALEINYEKAMRDFGSIPPRVSNQFIGTSVVQSGIFIGNKNTHLLNYDFSDNEIGGTLRRVSNSGKASLMSIDAGEVNNSFAVTVFTYDFATGKTICTTVVELIPRDGKRINHDKTYTTILKPLAEQTNTVVALADRWNSLSILQRLRTELKIKIQQITPRRRDFDAVLSALTDKTIECPRPEIPMEEFIGESIDNYRSFFVNKPVAHLAHQMTTVQDMGVGKCPDKGNGYTDDLFRAFVLGASKINSEKIQKILQEAAIKQGNSNNPAPVAFGRSSMRIR